MNRAKTITINYPILFGLIACSWMPHWSCHYYRIETGSTFKIATYALSEAESYFLMLFYTILIVASLMAISKPKLRFPAALVSGIFHLLLGSLHLFRLFAHFEFEVLGYEWSYAASLRESLIVFPFGVFCIWLAFKKAHCRPVSLCIRRN